MTTKDYFSDQSKSYATFRPIYPDAVYQFIYSHLRGHKAAWDCATGNGQVARELAKHFRLVCATDISNKQLEHAFKAENIAYSVAPAEKTSFSENQFDLITVAQALHWFQFDKFYKEVNRVAKQNALLAVWGYGLCSIDSEVDKLFLEFYHDILGPYWDQSRKHVENKYEEIPFPFKETPSPQFSIKVNWSFETFLGYLTTWSSTQKYIREVGSNPVGEFSRRLAKVWPTHQIKRGIFPLFMKLGHVKG